MGSWNATCGVTQLPIKEGDRVVLVPLVVKNHDFLSRSPLSGSGSVDNDLIAQPFTLPLLGAYNGYGGISLSFVWTDGCYWALLCALSLLKSPVCFQAKQGFVLRASFLADGSQRIPQARALRAGADFSKLPVYSCANWYFFS